MQKRLCLKMLAFYIKLTEGLGLEARSFLIRMLKNMGGISLVR